MTSSPTNRSQQVDTTAPTTGISGWYAFAGCMLLVAGFLNLMHGYTALSQSNYLVNQLLYDNLDVWGWVFLGWGLLQLLAGGLALGMKSSGAVIGVVLSSIAMVLWFGMIFAAPFAAIVGIALNASIVYGLTRVEL